MLLNKYSGKLGKIEAEIVQELLDMHDGDEKATRRFVISTLRANEAGYDRYSKLVHEYHNQLDAYHSQTWWQKIWRRWRGLPPLELPELPKYERTDEEETAATLVAMTMVAGARWYYDGLVHLGVLKDGEAWESLD